MKAIKSLEILKSEWKDPTPEKPRSYPPVLHIIRFSFATLGRLFPKTAGQIAYRLFSTPRARAKHKASDSILESAQLFEVLYGKQILKGYEWGKGAKTILLVHGWESRGTGLRSFVPQLVSAGFRVIAFDGPAHGNSDGKRTNLPHFAGAVRAIINHERGVAGVIAHSFGGAATIYAMLFLDNTITLEKLVLIGVPSRLKKILESAMRTLNVPPQAMKEFLKIIKNKIQNTSISAVDVATADGKIKVNDALIVHDRYDKIVPFASAELVFKNWKNASLLVSEGYGHYRMMKNPDLVKKVVDFLDEKGYR